MTVLLTTLLLMTLLLIRLLLKFGRLIVGRLILMSGRLITTSGWLYGRCGLGSYWLRSCAGRVGDRTIEFAGCVLGIGGRPAPPWPSLLPADGLGAGDGRIDGVGFAAPGRFDGFQLAAACCGFAGRAVGLSEGVPPEGCGRCIGRAIGFAAERLAASRGGTAHTRPGIRQTAAARKQVFIGRLLHYVFRAL